MTEEEQKEIVTQRIIAENLCKRLGVEFTENPQTVFLRLIEKLDDKIMWLDNQRNLDRLDRLK